MKSFAKTGKAFTDKRCDYKIKNTKKKVKAVQRFNNRLKYVESHYCCSETVRIYLPCELSISGLYRMYLAQTLPEEAVKRSYFRHILTLDIISVSTVLEQIFVQNVQFSERIENENDHQHKSSLMAQQ